MLCFVLIYYFWTLHYTQPVSVSNSYRAQLISACNLHIFHFICLIFCFDHIFHVTCFYLKTATTKLLLLFFLSSFFCISPNIIFFLFPPFVHPQHRKWNYPLPLQLTHSFTIINTLHLLFLVSSACQHKTAAGILGFQAWNTEHRTQ